MDTCIVRRVTSIAVTVTVLSATSAIPVHVHADHEAQQRHVERAHGGHDAVWFQSTDDCSVGGKVICAPEATAQHALLVPLLIAGARCDAAKDPPARPPDYRSPPRAPPALM